LEIIVVRRKVRILVPVWGEAYIRSFAALSLPSLLSADNLPYLTEIADVELCLLTRSSDFDNFSEQPAFRRLKTICKVLFVAIDDLVGSHDYGVILTLAYMRGISNVGSGMVDVHFVFLNADFILANGSYKSLARHILADHHCVFAPSFRANAEVVEPALTARVDAVSNSLTLHPREMVRLAIDNMHPTCVAKTIGQDVVFTSDSNQYYWRVDDQTIIGHFFLSFMLCIKPEREVYVADSFCDYGFVPTFCPTAERFAICDSDDFFMLETQQSAHELSHIQFGKRQLAEDLRSLREWTTVDHRWMSKQMLVFHAGQLPKGFDLFARQAHDFINCLHNKLENPCQHSFHPYWIAAVQSWASAHRFDENQTPVELAPIPTMLEGSRQPWLRQVSVAISRRLVGTRPDLTILHYDWLNYHLIRRHLSDWLGKSDSKDRLLLAPSESMLSSILRSAPGAKHSSLAKADFEGAISKGRSTYTQIAVETWNIDSLLANKGTGLLQLIGTLIPNGELLIFVTNRQREMSPSELSIPITKLAQLATVNQLNIRLNFCSHGCFFQLLGRSYHRAAHFFFRHGFKSLFILAPVMLFLMLFSFLINISQWIAIHRGFKPHLDRVALAIVTIKRDECFLS
jgi:hypothetical protein